MSKAGTSKGAKGAPVVPEVPPPPPVAPPEDPIRLELMKQFLAARETTRADMNEFNNAKQREWLTFFGFSMERELMWAKDQPEQFMVSTNTTRKAVGSALRNGNKSTPMGASAYSSSSSHAAADDAAGVAGPEFYGRRPRPQSPKNEFRSTLSSSTLKKSKKGAGGPANAADDDDADGLDGYAKSDDPIQGNRPAEGCSVQPFLDTMTDRLEEADRRAMDAPRYEGKSIAYIADQLCAPYKNITWRLDEAQSALLKARVVYRWLCKNMTMALPQSGAAEGGTGGANPKGHGKTLTFADLPAGAGASAAGGALSAAHALNSMAPKSALSKKGGASSSTTALSDGRAGTAEGAHHHGVGVNMSAATATAESGASTLTRSDPILNSRVGNPRNLAAVFSDFMMCVGVDGKDVKGSLKGTLDHRGKPSGYLRWGWNMLSVPPAASTNGKPLRLLIDIALSMVTVNPSAGLNPLMEPAKGSGNAAGSAAGGPPTTPSGGRDNSKPSPRPQSPQTNKANRNSQVKEEDVRAQNEASAMSTWHALQHEKVKNYSAATPKFNIIYDLVPHYEPFYFGCDPRRFASLHFPDEPEKYLLLQQSVARPQWESYPRLTHLFYRHSLELASHKRRTVIQCRAAPLYVAFNLGDCANVELTAAIFKGTVSQQNLAEINNNAANTNALGPGYVYSQRCEKEGKVTFTLMTPDVGVYTVVFGARRVNTDLFAVGPCNTPFDIVATYQVQMNFVALNEPVLPHQHLTAATLKLVEPRDHKAVVGRQRFVVVPTSPRVLCVAVINRLFKHSAQPSASVIVGPNSSIPVIASPTAQQPPPSAGNGSGKLSPKRSSGKNSARGQPSNPLDGLLAATAPPPPPPPPAVVSENVRITLLELNATMGTFEGDVDAQQGVAEIWVLLGDPRCLANTVSFTASKISGMAAGGALPQINGKERSGSALGLFPPITGNSNRPMTSSSAVSDRNVSTPPLLGNTTQQRNQSLGSQQNLLANNSNNSHAGVGATSPTPPALNAALIAAVTANYPNSQILTSLSPEAIACLPIEEPSDVRNGSNGRIQGVFVPAITDLHVVKRIMPKECMLNEGRGVIQPVLMDGGRLMGDLPYIFRLMSGSTVDGRKRTADANAFIGKPLSAVGSYFADRQ